MSDRPIIFSAPMVRALLDRRKTMTRRVIVPPAPFAVGDDIEIPLATGSIKPKWQVGDRLWVREGGFLITHPNWHNPTTRQDVWEPVGWRHAADDAISGFNGHDPGPYIGDCSQKRSPSIHMPRWASRLTLTVTGVKVERLQEISEADARAEGVPAVMEGNTGDEIYCPTCQGNGVHGALGANYGATEVDCSECDTAKKRFANLWQSINGPGSWEANPWVACYSFTVERRNIDEARP